MLYQTIYIEDERSVDWGEVFRAMPNDGLSRIILNDPSPACTQQWSEPISEARN